MAPSLVYHKVSKGEGKRGGREGERLGEEGRVGGRGGVV